MLHIHTPRFWVAGNKNLFSWEHLPRVQRSGNPEHRCLASLEKPMSPLGGDTLPPDLGLGWSQRKSKVMWASFCWFRLSPICTQPVKVTTSSGGSWNLHPDDHRERGPVCKLGDYCPRWRMPSAYPSTSCFWVKCGKWWMIPSGLLRTRRLLTRWTYMDRQWGKGPCWISPLSCWIL